MLFLRFLLFLIGFGFLAAAAAVVLYDVYLEYELGRFLRWGVHAPGEVEPRPTAAPLRPRRAIRWNEGLKLVVIAALLSLSAKSIVVIPDGEAAVRVSQLSGVQPGTIYAGTHLIFPLVDRVVLLRHSRQGFFDRCNRESCAKSRKY